ncbi:MAG: alpha/beta hydrolase family protein, partial [Gemmatimonadota bacterium]
GSAPLPAQVVGDWSGSLQAGGAEFFLVLHVTESEDALSATIDSPDQGAYGIEASSTIYANDTLTVTFAAIAGEYVGTLSEEGKLVGTWTQGGGTFPLEFVPSEDDPPEANRPQEPQKPYPYSTEDLVFGNDGAGIELAGTLTLPEGPGPHPAAVLISGSGPQNRDEEVFGHRPFLVLADYLTRQGIAVLRYDDRGVGASGGSHETATSADFAGDAASAVAYLGQRGDIDVTQIGLIGHSEGGVIAPLVAVESEDVAYVIMIAGPGVRGDSLLMLQAEAINRAAGATDEQVATNRDLQRRLFAAVASHSGEADLETEVRRVFDEASVGMTAGQIDGQVAFLTTPWMRWFLSHDPVPVLQRLTVPTLAVTGSKDLQVPAEANLSAIENALEAAGNPDFQVVALDGLNHLLQTAETGLINEYGRIEETIAPVALQTIGDWIAQRFLGS